MLLTDFSRIFFWTGFLFAYLIFLYICFVCVLINDRIRSRKLMLMSLRFRLDYQKFQLSLKEIKELNQAEIAKAEEEKQSIIFKKVV